MIAIKLLGAVEVGILAATLIACTQSPTPSARQDAEGPVTATRPLPPDEQALAPAQEPSRPRWRASDDRTAPHLGWRFDPATVETVEGRIEGILRTPPHERRGGGVHLALATPDGLITVALGPAWYVDRQEPALQEGDEVRVFGSLVGDSVIVASKVARGAEELRLRDDAGAPVWRGWRRRGGPGT